MIGHEILSASVTLLQCGRFVCVRYVCRRGGGALPVEGACRGCLLPASCLSRVLRVNLPTLLGRCLTLGNRGGGAPDVCARMQVPPKTRG